MFLISTTDKQQMQMQEKEKKSCAKKKKKGNEGQRAEIKQAFNFMKREKPNKQNVKKWKIEKGNF